jgi:UrcA family protein
MSRFLKMKQVIPCVLAVVASPLTAVAMQGGLPDAEPPKRVVNFADLDLSRDAGVAALYQRITSAAREVCRPEDFWTEKTRNFDCRHAAVARAISDVQSPALTSYYLARNKGSAASVKGAIERTV